MTWHRLARKQGIDAPNRDQPLVSIQRSGDFYLNRYAMELCSIVFGSSILYQRVALLVDDFLGVGLLTLDAGGWMMSKKASGAGALSKVMKRPRVIIGVGQYRLSSVDVPESGLTLPGFAWTREGVGWLETNSTTRGDRVWPSVLSSPRHA